MELPVASSRGRAMRPAPRPPVSDYENVAESDLPQFQSTNEQWSSRPVTYRPTSAWKQ